MYCFLIQFSREQPLSMIRDLVTCEVCLETGPFIRRECAQCRGRVLCDDCNEQCGGHCPICQPSLANHVEPDDDMDVHVYLLTTDGITYEYELQAYPSVSYVMDYILNTVVANWSQMGNPPSGIGVLVTNEAIPEEELEMFGETFGEDYRTLRWFWVAEQSGNDVYVPVVHGREVSHPIHVHTPYAFDVQTHTFEELLTGTL